jgi:hypothetical protein
MRCLQKDPCDRYQNVAELAVGLAPFGSKRFASYPERCRTLLAGEGLGRRATASAPTSASRYDSSPPDEAGSGRSSKLELVEPRRGLLPTGAQHPGGSPRGGTVEPHYAARIPPRSLPTVTGIPRLPTDGVGGDTSERRQGLLVAHPSLLYPQNATDSGLNLLSEPTLARLDANHGQRAAVQPSELRRTHNFVVTEEELLLQLRPRGWLWVVAGIAAIAFAAIYMSTQGQQPTSAYVARGAALGSSSAPSPRLKPEVISPSASQPAPISDVGNTVALQPSAAEANSGESEAPGAGAAAASDLPTRANSHRMDAPRARAKSSIKSSGSRKYDADDEVDVGF